MRRLLLLMLSCVWMTAAWSDGTPVDPLLNKVTLRLTAEQWVTTKTALATMSVSATVNENDVGTVQNRLLDKLNQLVAKTDWHIISFNRSLDQSGLEKIQVIAQARLPEATLVGLRDKAKKISKPGETFTLDNIEFTPTDEDLHAANAALRANIYQQAKSEIEQLNKMYPEQKYYLNQINFMEAAPIAMVRTPQMSMGQATNVSMSAPLAIGDKVKLAAIVVLAAAPGADVLQFVKYTSH